MNDKNISQAQAGTLESNDILIHVAPGQIGSGIIIELKSIVMRQYGDAIRQTITETIKEAGLTDIYINATDRGALDCTIKARTLAALKRAGALAAGEAI